MRFGVLGPLAVWTSEGAEIQVPEAKVRALLAVLLSETGRAVSADRLAETLWAGRPPGNPGNTLQTKISHLRGALERGEPGSRALVAHQAPGYVLRVAPRAVDAHRFAALVAEARRASDLRRRAAVLSEALALWRGRAYAEFADEPLLAARARHWEEERMAACEDLLEARLELGEHAALLGELHALLAEHPLRERLRAVQMRALYRAGRQSEALDVFARLRELLGEALGADPGPELQALHQAILRHDHDLSPAPPPIPALAGARTVQRPRGNLPAALTDLIGREKPVREVTDLMARRRLVTLIGPGGVGKTRLALAAAEALAHPPPGGVWLVELAGAEATSAPTQHPVSEERIAEAVAGALDIRQAAAPHPGVGPPDPAGRLAEALRGSPTLLVLDNCEQSAGPVARLAARLLAAAPALRILATSREALGMAGEALYEVPALDLPAEAGPDDRPAPAPTAQEVARFGAVKLFAERASAAAPGFTVGEGNAAAIAEICRRLDGLPLALELAATRVRTLGVHELLARLDHRFHLLSEGLRQGPARQRTLRAVIDWSWELLGEAERCVLRRLAVQAEGCTLAAAEAVCAGDGVPAEAVAGLLARLVDRSLVMVRHDEQEGPRYRLLESVAEYGRERLHEAGEAEAVARRHSRFYCDLAEQALPGLRGGEQRRWLRRLDAESANLAAALDGAAGRGDAEVALRMSAALAWYWFLRGRHGEAVRRLRQAVELGGAAESEHHPVAAAWLRGVELLLGGRVELLHDEVTEAIADPAARRMTAWFLGYVATTLGEMELGARWTERALADAGAAGDGWVRAAALSIRANQAMDRAEMAAAREAAQASAQIFERLGDRWGLLQALFVLGAHAEAMGEYARAQDQFRQGRRLAEELGLWTEVGYQYTWLGRLALLTGDMDQAEELHRKGRDIAVEQGFTPGEMYAVTGLALGARRRGDLEAAEGYAQAVLDWHREIGQDGGRALMLAELGFIAELRGDARTALRRHREGLAAARRGGGPRAIALAWEGMAGAHLLGGAPARAARLLGAAAAMRESVGAPLPSGERGDVDRITACARAALGEERFAAEFDRGAVEGVEEP